MSNDVKTLRALARDHFAPSGDAETAKALTRAADALALVQMAEGAEAIHFTVWRYIEQFMADASTGDDLHAMGLTPDAARRALAARLIATAIALVKEDA